MKSLIYISIAFTFFLLSCSKKELGPQCVDCPNDFTETELSDVLIVNEGPFMTGSGTVSLYKPSNQTISNNVYFQANAGNNLGNIAQSITQIDNKAYIVINNASKIEIADINNFTSLGTITGFNSPRYMLPINTNKAYVTDLYSNSIQIVDLNSNSISGSIPLSGWTEELLLHNDTVYACDVTNNNLLLLNPNTNTLVDSVKLGVQPLDIVKDQNNKLWIMCNGGINEANPKLIRFNPTNRTIEHTFVFPSIAESPGNLKINATGDQLYFINSNVYKMNISSNSLPTLPLITNNNNIYYGLGIDPTNEEVYVSDAIDYVQNGVIFRYTPSGALIDQFTAGIIPRDFLFIQ